MNDFTVQLYEAYIERELRQSGKEWVVVVRIAAGLVAVSNGKDITPE